MARKRSPRRPAKRTTRRKATAKRTPVARRKPAKKKPRLTRLTEGERAVPPKLADTDAQIQALRHLVSEQCVSIASSIDTNPPQMIPPEMRDRWLRELRQAAVALVPVIERLAGGPTTDT